MLQAEWVNQYIHVLRVSHTSVKLWMLFKPTRLINNISHLKNTDSPPAALIRRFIYSAWTGLLQPVVFLYNNIQEMHHPHSCTTIRGFLQSSTFPTAPNTLAVTRLSVTLWWNQVLTTMEATVLLRACLDNSGGLFIKRKHIISQIGRHMPSILPGWKWCPLGGGRVQAHCNSSIGSHNAYGVIFACDIGSGWGGE